MAKHTTPTCRVQILLVETSKNAAETLYENFNKVKGSLEKSNAIFIEFVKAITQESALDYIEKGIVPTNINKQLKAEYGDVQAVVINWEVCKSMNFIKQIVHIRNNIHLFIITSEQNTYDLYNPNIGNVHFIQKKELVNNHLLELQRIINTFNERRRTPFWTAYKEYVEEANYTWHTPGHAGGQSFKNSPYLYPFYEFFGTNVFLGDLSVSVEHLGSLLDSTGYVGLTEAKAARTFNVRKTFFVTNGSSNSNKIILQTLLNAGDKAIIDRNCHKSVHYSLIQSRATPIYINSQFSSKYGIFAPPSIKDIENAIKKNPDVKVVVLTGCTYDGILIPVRKVVELVKKFNKEKKTNIKVFIDEAWFGYSSFHPYFAEYSAILSGADYITHSAHKVLSAFSQSSYIHVNDPDFDEDYFREIFHLYTSTSPQYQIIASLGVCSMQMETEGFKLLGKALEQAQRFRDAVRKRLTKIKVIEFSDFQKEFKHLRTYGYGNDPLKVLLDVSALESEMKDIQQYLQEKGFEVEKTTVEGTILFLFTIGTSTSKEGELFFALSELEKESKRFDRKLPRGDASIKIPDVETAGLSYFFKPREPLPIADSLGRISSFFVTPYPPGIPVLVPGQTITKDHIEYIEQQMKDNRIIHGCDNGLIFVTKKKD
ncbi:MAG: aminotransferase class I/II-fold pyridoxal phosphate-dependent enzyme [Prevotellaceae bacterium]|jgi:lysine decarboxylase/arginine decarboxylase|nr:aminotransferase class I/II-fold pyridoxal phosphate-dependent enzyme [Prevotellaceae bacterium]